MFNPFFIVLALILAFLVYKFLTKNLNYWKNRKVAHPEPAPFFGNYGDAMRTKMNFGFVSANIYNAFPKEKYVGGLIGNKPVLVIRDPDLIKLIMAKDFYYFNCRGFASVDLKLEPLNLNLFSTDGDNWRVLRQNLTPLFSSAKMRNMFHLMAQCGREFEDLVRRRQGETGEVDIPDLMSRFFVDVIGSCAFGLQTNSMSEENNQFRRMGVKIFESSFSKNVTLFTLIIAPWLYRLLRLRILNKELTKFFIDLSRQVIESRKGNPPERHDFIDLLVQLKQCGHIDGDSIQSMKSGVERSTVSLPTDENLLAAQSFIFFAAGFETSSMTTSYALYELALNPEVQERAHAEIDALLEKHGGKIDYETVHEARYLNMVASEAMRKYPVLAAITRQCTSRYTLPDGLVVEEGVRVHLPVYALHHDPQYYPEPERFDPERFTPEAVRERHQYVYMPFGEGQRICIGMRFGKMQVIVGLISLLRNFSVEPCARTESTLQFEPKSNITKPKNDIWLKLTPRKKNE